MQSFLRGVVALCLGSLLAFGNAGALHGAEARLVWNNGDRLQGSLVDASATELRWNSPLFKKTFSIDFDYLRGAYFLRPAKQATPETFRVELRNGDILSGTLKEITDQHLVLQSLRHGEMKLQRSHLRSGHWITNPSVLFVGPGNGSAWRTSKGSQVIAWKSDADGFLSTSTRNADLFHQMDFPEKTEVIVDLRWSGKLPDFSLSLARPEADPQGVQMKFSFQITAWEDELIIETSSGFEPVKTLDPSIKQMQLRLYWDRKENVLSVYSREGKLLSSAKVPAMEKQGQVGLYLRNNSNEKLSVAHIRVGAWNGQLPQEIRAGETRVHLQNGEIAYGHIESYSSSTQQLKIVDSFQGESSEPTDNATTFKAEELTSLFFSDVTEKPEESESDPRTPKGNLRLSYFDGTRLLGQLVSIEANVLRLQIPSSKQVVECHLAGIRHLKFTTTKQPAKQPNKQPTALLEHVDGMLHGELVTGDQAYPFGWKPVGSRNDSPFKEGCNAKVSFLANSKKSPDLAALTDLLYLRNRDILPCRVVGIDEKVVNIETGYGENGTIEGKSIKAIDFASDSNIFASGFGSPHWKRSGQVKFSKKATLVDFGRGGQISHPDLLYGDEVRFDAHWDPTGFLQLVATLYGVEGDQNGSGVYITLLLNDGKIRFSSSSRPEGSLAVDGKFPPVKAPGGKASFRFIASAKELRVFVDNKLAYKTKINNVEGTAFALRGHQLNYSAANRRPKQSILELSNFEVRKNFGSRTTIRILPEKKESILTLPRLYRDRPPTHIAVAENGDLLRGRLTGLSKENIFFASRNDAMIFPRDRLASLIWLHQDEMKGAGAPPAVVAKDAVRLVLTGQTTLSLVPSHIKEDKLVGQSPILGLCSIPLEYIREVHLGDFVKFDDSLAYADWFFTAAPEPKFVDGGGAGGGSDSGTSSPLIGTTPANFKLPTVAGKPFELSDYQGKVVVLDFWATWCGPCLQALPEVMKAVDSFDSDEVVLIGLNQQEPKEDVAEFLEGRQWKLNVALDPGNVAQQFNVSGIPQTVLIGKDGKIKHLHVGSRPDMQEMLKASIAELLKE